MAKRKLKIQTETQNETIKKTQEPQQNKSSKFNSLKNKETLSYDDIAEMVEHLVKTNAYKYAFEGFSIEDIAQEIRKKCFLLLQKWNNKKPNGNPIWFFGFSMQNHLKNLRRDHGIHNPNYDCEQKKIVAPLYQMSSNDSYHFNNKKTISYGLLDSEAKRFLTPTEAKYFDQMIENLSLRKIPRKIRERIVEVMNNIMDADTESIDFKELEK